MSSISNYIFGKYAGKKFEQLGTNAGIMRELSISKYIKNNLDDCDN